MQVLVDHDEQGTRFQTGKHARRVRGKRAPHGCFNKLSPRLSRANDFDLRRNRKWQLRVAVLEIHFFQVPFESFIHYGASD